MKKLITKEDKMIQSLDLQGITLPSVEVSVKGTRETCIKCLWNTLITYLILIGITGIFIDAFDLPCSFLTICIFDLLISLYFSFLYLNSVTFNLGYIFIFVFILFATISLYMIVNSGFSAILNLIIIKVDEVMSLPTIREYKEFYTERFISITACICLISILYCCIINMWVSRRKSIFSPILNSLVWIELSIYLTDEFNLFYFVLLLTGIVLFAVTKANDKIVEPYKKKSKRYKIEKNNIILQNYKIDKKGNIITSLSTVILIVFISMICFSFVSSLYTSSQSPLKKETDEIVYNVAWKGLGYLFNKSLSGGMDNGRFGDVDNITFDGNTDLEVSFVPYTLDSIYLPSFHADHYNSKERRWQNFISEEDDKYYNSLQYNLLSVLSKKNNEAFKTGTGKIVIKNVEAANAVSFQPYFSYDYNSEPIYIGNYVTYDFFSNLNNYEYLNNLDYKDLDLTVDDFKYFLEKYDNYNGLIEYTEPVDSPPESIKELNKIVKRFNKTVALNPSYLQVPEEIESDLKKIINKNNFGGSTEEIIMQLQEYFAENYNYTLRPGSTPDNEDYVLYFLTKQKKGFCVHFASSACMLLRTMGVPARYCEGYCFDPSAYEDAVLLSENTDYNINEFKDYEDKWYNGYSEINFEEPISVELTDANAHAWVEVWFQNYGWVPVEFTVGAFEDDGEEDISSLLNALRYRNNDNNGANAINAIQNIADSNTMQSIKSLFSSAFGNFVQLVIIIILLIIIIKHFILIYRLYYSKKETRVIYQYREIVNILKFISVKKAYSELELSKSNIDLLDMDLNDTVNTQNSVFSILTNAFNLNIEDTEALKDIYLSICFDKNTIYNLHDATKLFRKTVKGLLGKLKFRHKLKYKIKYFSFNYK